MPNWCQNEVRVMGETKELENFREFVQGEEEPFCFNSILPMPKELLHTVSPVEIYETQEEIDEYLKSLENQESYKYAVEKCMTREYHNYLMKTYGSVNWYDWCIENWGTKWDIDTVEFHDNIEEWGELTYEFDTAWCPPEEIHKFLTDKFPSMMISWFYKEEGEQFAGYL